MFKRYFILIAGWALILSGSVIAPLPLPFGIPMMIIGTCMIAPSSPMVQRFLRRMRTRFPAANEKLEQIEQYLPEFVRRVLEITRPGADKPPSDPDDSDKQ